MHVGSNTIWQVPVYLPYLQPPLSEDLIRRAEAAIGHPLPPAYLHLLEQQNGGYIRYTLPDSLHSMIAGIGPHFPSITDLDWEDARDSVSFALDGLVPFDDDGHWYLCLDYRESPVPCVTEVDIECDAQQVIAKSFEAYLERLVLDVQDEYVFRANDDIDVVAVRLSSALGVQFEDQGTWDFGYRLYRAQLGSSDRPAWAFLSPNHVPRGFARSNEPRYNELEGLLPGEALRFPELADDSYLLVIHEQERERLLELLGRAGLVIRPIMDVLRRPSA